MRFGITLCVIQLIIVCTTIRTTSSLNIQNFKPPTLLPIIQRHVEVDSKDQLSTLQNRQSIPFVSHLPLLLLLSASVVNADTGTAIDPFKTNLVFSYWRYFLAGGICASFSHCLTVPFDVVKTRIQTSSDVKKKGVIDMTKYIVANDGVAMLFKGIVPTVIGYSLQGSLKFGFYEVFKTTIKYVFESVDIHTDKLIIFMIAGGLAETIASTFLSPFETTRIRMVSNPSFANGVVDCLSKIIRWEGTSTLFVGLPAILLKQVPYTIVSLSSFEFLSASVYSYLQSAGFTGEDTAKYQYLITASTGLIAAILSSLASQPGDTLLSEVNKSTKKYFSNYTTANQVTSMDETVKEDVAALTNMTMDGSFDETDNPFNAVNREYVQVDEEDDNHSAVVVRSRNSRTNIQIEKTPSSTMDEGSIPAVNPDVEYETNKMLSDSSIRPNAIRVIISTAKELGFFGLYKGTKARLILVSIIVVIQFLVYDFIKQLCGIPVTGFGGH